MCPLVHCCLCLSLWKGRVCQVCGDIYMHGPAAIMLFPPVTGKDHASGVQGYSHAQARICQWAITKATLARWVPSVNIAMAIHHNQYSF